MKEIFNQICRIWNDDGRNDKSFTKEENDLRTSKANLDKAISDFKAAADKLYDVLLSVD